MAVPPWVWETDPVKQNQMIQAEIKLEKILWKSIGVIALIVLIMLIALDVI